MTMTAQAMVIITGIYTIMHASPVSAVLFVAFCLWLYHEEHKIVQMDKQMCQPPTTDEFPDEQWNEDLL